MSKDQRDLRSALEPIISRVRTDVTAVKSERGMAWTREALTEVRIKRHLDGTGPARGVCPIKEGESTTRLALLDLDSHGGETSWPEMVAVAEDLIRRGADAHHLHLTPFRSSGGRGIHLFAVWDEPQDAYSVREALRELLALGGIRDGAKGVSQGQVEVFPKQDEVPEGGFGNQFILPLSGQSVPLEPMLDLEPMPREYAIGLEWPVSAPVTVVERPVVERREMGNPTSVELVELKAALDAIPNDTAPLGYDEWRNVIAGIHDATGGSDEGYALAYDFSARAPHFNEDELRDKVWDGWLERKGPSAKPITVASVFAVAREHGWQDVTAEDFPILVEPDEVDSVEPMRVLDPKDPMALARAFMRAKHTRDGKAVLLRSADLWYEHVGPCWTEVPGDELRQGLWNFLDGCQKEVTTKTENGKVTSIVPFCPSLAQVTSALDALKAVAAIKGVSPPSWLPGYKGPDPREVVSLSDGLLHIPTRTLLPHTPGLFTTNTLPYAWGPGEEPSAWLGFLEAVWPGDPEAQDAVQEMFGYLLTADTSQQKMFLVRGPKRSGKGTIARVLQALLGRENIVSPTLTALTSNFGLQPLIGKLVAMIPDARVGGQTNTQAIVEKLLMVSGEDSVTIDRKNKDAWTGTLSSRIVIMTNELPQLGDASGALAGRFITISMEQSFYGREDLGLTARLLKELPGIFRWALDGRDRLKARGYFVQPESAAEDAEELAEVNSPVTVFVDEVMEFGADFSVPITEAFEAWQTWCGQNGRSHAGTKQTFGKMVRAAYPEIKVWRPRVEGDRVREFTAIRIKQHVRSQMGLFGSA